MKCLFISLCDYGSYIQDVIPIGQLSLATLINSYSNKYQAEVIDINHLYNSNQLVLENSLSKNVENTAHYIANMKPDFISIYTMCNNHHIAILLTEAIKKCASNITICLAGPHATITAQDTLKICESVDFIAIGEGEDSIISILQALENNTVNEAYGIVAKNIDGTIITKVKPSLIEVDKLPYIDYSLLNFSISGKVPIEVGRGCPFNCTFCSTSEFWGRTYRVKSADRILKEIKTIIENYGLFHFDLLHDLFLLDRVLVIDFCKGIISSGLNITWSCSSRIDTIDKELLFYMSKAGCIRIYFGIETGSEKIQKSIQKNLNLDQIDNLVELLNEYTIEPTFSLIYGFPDEEINDIEDTLRLFYNLYNHYKDNYYNRSATIQLHRLFYLPGTAMYKKFTDKLEFNEKALNSIDLGTKANQIDTNAVDLIRNNKSIFPHFFEHSNASLDGLYYLNFFYGNYFRFLIEYFDCTYKALLKYFGSHVEVSKSIISYFTELKFISLHNKEYLNTGEVIAKLVIEFNNYMDAIDFAIKSPLVDDIYRFEKNIYDLLHCNDNMCSTESFKFDVVKYKKSNGILVEEKTIKIEFSSTKMDKKIKYVK